jgi:multidrug efflux pump subunit AcrA (membrane-fusion protein)
VLRNKMVAGIVVLALVLAAGGIGYANRSSGGSSAKKDLVILSDVQRRTLQDTVTLQGTLARQELRKVTSVSAGRVSAVYADDGSKAKAGDRLFALDGRDAIAEDGTVRFFRPLSVGDRGDDVLQLKQILAASGDNPGPLNTIFTEQTRFALAQWQAQHHYPGAVPDSPQTVTVSLGQGTGYTLGAQVAAGLTIGPGGAQTTAATTGIVHRAELTAFRRDTVTPTLKIQSLNAIVSEGTPATFSITASDAPTSPITVNLYAGAGNSATPDDVVIPPSVTLATGTTSVVVSVPTRVDNIVKPKKKLVLAIGAGNGYFIGSPNTAETTISNNNVPTVHISGATTLPAGGSATLRVTADQAPLHDTQVSLTLAGDAVPGTDYQTVNPVLLLRAGQKTASVTLRTLKSSEIQPNRHIVASITQAPASYSVGAPGIAVITIVGASGTAALPIVTLRSATKFLTRGGTGAAGVGGGAAYPVTISLSKAVSRPLTIVLAYGGNAAQGTDFTLPGGSIVVPPGQTSITVQIPIVSSNVVESNRVLIVAVASSSAYQIGKPNTTRVTIESQVVPELTLTANTASVSGGGAATFTITADQAPVKNTSVSYQVVGTAQPGQDFVPLVGTALLPAGHRTVTVTLRSIQKDVTFAPTDMIVASWPIRVGQVFVKEGDPVPPGTPILSLTDPNFTVTLQASASDRTKLKVGQHCTVSLVGGVNENQGTISELDQNLTSLDAGTPGGAPTQVYQGKIQVGDLGAADGAAVTIKVVDQQETNALTVPIAAVKQNGSGQDVVRVIDIAKSGKITEVPVQTGLTEGDYIEIKKGLKGDETVVSDARPAQ